MKKLLSILLAGMMLAGCGQATDSGIAEEAAKGAEEIKEQVEESVKEEGLTAFFEKLQETAGENSEFKILTPSGAPALSLIPAMLGSDVTVVDGADALQAALVNPTPEYDMIVAPSNLGMKLAASGKSPYKMLGVLTWGNLYIVGEKGTSNDASTWENVASFGQESVTGKVFASVYGDDLNLDDVTWYNSTAEASAALIAGDAKVAMLAEPNATATIAKAKENGVELEIIDDIQARYAGATGLGFPQAALFVNEEVYNEKKDKIDGMFNLLTMFSSDIHKLSAEEIGQLVDLAGGAETFGVPNAQIVGKVWDRLNINVQKASDYEDRLQDFGTMFGIEDVSSAILK